MMSAKRLFYALILSFVLLIAGSVGVTYVMSGLLKTKSAQLAASKAQVEQLNASENSIAKTKRDITKYSPLKQITDSIVPQDKDQAATVREIINIAAASKVPITSITFPSSSLGATKAKSVGSTTTTTAPSTAVKVASTPNLSQLTPVKNIPGVYDLQLTLSNNSSNSITFNQLSSFLKGLENNRRTATVSSISITPLSTDPNQLTFTLTIQVYIKP